MAALSTRHHKTFKLNADSWFFGFLNLNHTKGKKIADKMTKQATIYSLKTKRNGANKYFCKSCTLCEFTCLGISMQSDRAAGKTQLILGGQNRRFLDFQPTDLQLFIGFYFHLNRKY